MVLTVHVPEWELEESGRVLSVGDEHRCWLSFEEAPRSARSADKVRVIRGVAVPLRAWPGAELGRYPVRIELDAGVLYWDAPEPVSGALEVAGTVSSNAVDAPDGFPETTGVIRRLRREWHDSVVGHDESWAGRVKARGTRRSRRRTSLRTSPNR
jgi:hypothetical protein